MTPDLRGGRPHSYLDVDRIAARSRRGPAVGLWSRLRPQREAPERLGTGTVDPRSPGAPWWRYRRPEAPAAPQDENPGAPTGDRSPRVTDDGESGPPTDDGAADGTSPRPRVGLEQANDRERPGLVLGVLAAACLVIVMATGRMEVPAIGKVLIPAAGILAAMAFGQMLARRHPEEKWLVWALVLGVAVKIIGSVIRYQTLGGAGDAPLYDVWGKRFYHAWSTGGPTPDLTGTGSTGTQFVRWFTGVVYYLFGPDMLNGFLVFGLLAVVGSYLWYRAAVVAVPFLDRRLYFLLVFFVPSIAFWPSSIGKEALMQLGIGSMALGTAHLVRQRLWRGLLVALPGAYLLLRVRPHLLAFATFAAGAAYIFGRSRQRTVSRSTSVLRPIGIVLVIFVVFLAVSQGVKFLGLKDLSLTSVEDTLNQKSGAAAYGGSKIQTGYTTLSPLTLPQGAVKVLLRPFPWEVESSLQILASLEGAAVTLLILRRFESMSYSLTRARERPFLLYCWTLILLYAVGFSAIANYGLLVRQHSLVLPALFVLIAVDPAIARARDAEAPSPPPPRPVARALA